MTLIATVERRAAAVELSPGPAKIDCAEALEQGWLELWYQPKIDLKQLSVCGAEALLRVRHPELGILAPASFLPQTGDPLYEPLSRFVLQRAMFDWKRFACDDLFIKLSVNMPISIVGAPDFAGMMRQALPAHPRFPGLIVEVTEDEVIGDPELIREAAVQLKLYSVFLSIDDFGAAYSNLSRLLDLSCVEIKLDRSFVTDCSHDRLKRALCHAAIDLAHKFGAWICAEGVETSEDLTTLMDLGCDMAQGYFFQRPIAADAFMTFMKHPSNQPAKYRRSTRLRLIGGTP